MAAENTQSHISQTKADKRDLCLRIGSFGVESSEIKPAMVRLDSKQELVEYPVSWVQLCKIGRFEGHYAGSFEFTEELFGQIIRNFRATQNRALPLDFEHASELPGYAGEIPSKGAPATGWIIELQNRGAAGLWGMVAWLEPGLTYVREKRYRYLSPAFNMNAYDRVTGDYIGCELTSAALTNRPFLDGMASVTASQRRNNEVMSDTDNNAKAQDKSKNSEAIETAIRLSLGDRAKPTFEENLATIGDIVAENKALSERVATFTARENAEIEKKIESDIAVLLSNGSITKDGVDDARKLAKDSPEMFGKLFSHKLALASKGNKTETTAKPASTTLSDRQIAPENNPSKTPGAGTPSNVAADRDASIEKIAMRIATANKQLTRQGRPTHIAIRSAISEYERGVRE